jgi:hypothetical protein
MVDCALLLLGAALALAYFPLIGDHLERKFKAPRMITLMPVLLALGLAVLCQAAIRPGLVTLELKLSLAIPGLALVLASLAAFGKLMRKS